jgi:hypothetical protein
MFPNFSNETLGNSHFFNKIIMISFKIRMLCAADAEIYREVRLQALHEHPPAFGSIPEDEPNLLETADENSL